MPTEFLSQQENKEEIEAIVEAIKRTVEVYGFSKLSDYIGIEEQGFYIDPCIKDIFFDETLNLANNADVAAAQSILDFVAEKSGLFQNMRAVPMGNKGDF